MVSGYHGDDWNLSPKHKLETLCGSLIPVEWHLSKVSRDQPWISFKAIATKQSVLNWARVQFIAYKFNLTFEGRNNTVFLLQMWNMNLKVQQDFIVASMVTVCCLNYWWWDALLCCIFTPRVVRVLDILYTAGQNLSHFSPVWATPNLFTVQSLQLDSSSQTKAAHRGSQEPAALHWSVSHSCRFR